MDVCLYLLFRKSAESEEVASCVAFNWVEPDETVMYTAQDAVNRPMDVNKTADQLVRQLLREATPEQVLPFDMFCAAPQCRTRAAPTNYPMRDLLTLTHALQLAIQASPDGTRVKAHYVMGFSCGTQRCAELTTLLLQAHADKTKAHARGFKLRTCHKCGKVDTQAADQPKWHRCAQCRLVYYCTKECGVGDWAVHKTVCEKKE
jgi:hypothetical protein